MQVSTEERQLRIWELANDESKTFLGDPNDSSGASARPLLLSDPSAPVRLLPRSLLGPAQGQKRKSDPVTTAVRVKVQPEEIVEIDLTDDRTDSDDDVTMSSL